MIDNDNKIVDEIVDEIDIDTTRNTSNKSFGFREFLKKNTLAVYFALILIIGWFPWYTTGSGIIFWAPIISFVIISGLVNGKQEILRVLKSMFKWKAKPIWYIIVLSFPVIFALIAVGIRVISGGTAPDFAIISENPLSILFLTFIFLFPLTATAFQEEMGFRGYALPIAQKKYGPLVGTLIIGAFFGAWLLPEFFNSSSAQYAMGGMSYYPWFILTELSWSIIMTWIYNNTKGSALISGWLLHGFFNLWTLLLLTNAVMGEEFEAFDEVLLIIYSVVVTGAAIVITIVTKGRLSYDRLPKEEICNS